jgi:hypothetical protein
VDAWFLRQAAEPGKGFFLILFLYFQIDNPTVIFSQLELFLDYPDA